MTGRDAPPRGVVPLYYKEHWMERIAVCVNQAKLLASLRYAFTNKYTVVTELMQNARRAKASYVAVDYDGKAQTLTRARRRRRDCRMAERSSPSASPVGMRLPPVMNTLLAWAS